MKPRLYTTSEYLDALQLQSDGNLYQCKGKDFMIFENKDAAAYDADYMVTFWAKEGKRVKRPVVYRIKLERVK